MTGKWKETTLGEICNIQQGKTIALSSLSDGSYPVYGANGIVGKIDEFNFDFQLTALGCRGSCGTVHFIDQKVFLSGNVMAIWQKSDQELLPKYIPLALSALDLVGSGAITGQVQPQITKTSLSPVPISVPTIPEQKRIVDLISSVDVYVESLEDQLAKAKRARNALIHSFMNESIGRREETQLGKIAEFLNGRAYSREELLNEGKYRVLRVGNFFSNNNWYWSDLELEPNKFCENGDLLYAWSASFGPRIWEEEKVIYHYHIWKVNPDPLRVDKKWLFYWLEDDVERIKSSSGTGSIMMHVTKAEIEKRKINLPDLIEQQAQVVLLQGFDLEISALQSLISATRQLRESMLSELLSGKHQIPSRYDQFLDGSL
jgi:type I restriction enzyme S subunit